MRERQEQGQHTPGPWVVDAAPDARGFATVRRSDGSEHGDLDREPIATVYADEDAALIAAAPETAAERDRLKALNAELVAALESVAGVPFSAPDNGPRWDEGYRIGWNAALDAVYARASAALAAAKAVTP